MRHSAQELALDRPREATLDRRSSERTPVSTPASVGILGTGKRLDGQVVQVSDRGLQLLLPVWLTPGTLLEIIWNDTLALGEVVHIGGEPGSYLAGIKAQHAIFGIADLARALRNSEW